MCYRCVLTLLQSGLAVVTIVTITTRKGKSVRSSHHVVGVVGVVAVSEEANKQEARWIGTEGGLRVVGCLWCWNIKPFSQGVTVWHPKESREGQVGGRWTSLRWRTDSTVLDLKRHAI